MPIHQLKYDVSLDAPTLKKCGALAEGAYGTYDATGLHCAPLPMHLKYRAGVLTVTFQLDYVDRRVHLRLAPNLPLLVCQACSKQVRELYLSNDGVFGCAACVPGRVKPVNRTRELTDWEDMQARVLELRRQLHDYTSAPKAIKWPGHPMRLVTWRALVSELADLEPRMLDAYRERVGRLFADVAQCTPGASNDQAQKSPLKGA